MPGLAASRDRLESAAVKPPAPGSRRSASPPASRGGKERPSCRPSGCPRWRRRTSAGVSTARPATSAITSPVLSPFSAAGLLGSTPTTATPRRSEPATLGAGARERPSLSGSTSPRSGSAAARSPGRRPIVTDRSRLAPSRQTWTVAVVPGPMKAIWRDKSRASRTALPSTARTTSPALRPASGGRAALLDAGDDRALRFVEPDAGGDVGVTGWIWTPRKPRSTVPSP